MKSQSQSTETETINRLSRDLFEGKVSNLKGEIAELSTKVEARSKAVSAAEQQIAEARRRHTAALEDGEKQLADAALDDIKNCLAKLEQLRQEGRSLAATIQDLQNEATELKPFIAKFSADADRLQEAARVARQVADGSHGAKVHLLTALNALDQQLAAQVRQPKSPPIPQPDPAEQARRRHDALLEKRKRGEVPQKAEYDKTTSLSLEGGYGRR